MNKIISGLMTMLPVQTPAALLTIESSKLVTGTKELLNDAAIVLTAIAGAVAIIALIVMAIMKMAADENEAPRYKKRMIGVVIAFVIVLCASGITAILTNYYL